MEALSVTATRQVDSNNLDTTTVETTKERRINSLTHLGMEGTLDQAEMQATKSTKPSPVHTAPSRITTHSVP